MSVSMTVHTDTPPLPPPAKKEENGGLPRKAAVAAAVQSTANGGDAAMTIEFLRARLLSERSASKAAQTQAKQHQARILELQQQIEGEISRRKKAEAAVDQVFQNLKRKGLPIEPFSLLHLPSSSDDSSAASESLANSDMAPPESTERMMHSLASDQQKQTQVWEDKGTLVESNARLSINHTITLTPTPTPTSKEEGIDKTSPQVGVLSTCYNEKERQLSQDQDEEKEKEKAEKEKTEKDKDKDVAANPNYSTTLALVPEKIPFSKELHNGSTSAAFTTTTTTTTTTLEGQYLPIMFMAPYAHYWNIPFATAPPPDYPRFLPQMASPYVPYPCMKAPSIGSPQTVPSRIGKPQASCPPHFTSFIPSEWGGGGGNNMIGQEDGSFPLLPSLADEKSGRLGNVLTALRIAKKQVITDKQVDCLVTSPKEEEEEEKQSTGDSYDYHVTSPPPYLEHNEGIRSSPLPWQCWSPYYAPPPGLVANIPPPSYNQSGPEMVRTMPPPPPFQSYYKPKREVQLGNGITLYTD